VLEYDLARLSEHPLLFWDFLPYCVALFGGDPRGDRVVEVQWKRSAADAEQNAEVSIRWDTAVHRTELPRIEHYIATLLACDDDRAAWGEKAAVIVAIAVMAFVEPGSRFTRRSSNTATRHDYFLNDNTDEMIEVKGRSQRSMSSLFSEACDQSDRNVTLRKRWVSVTVFLPTLHNRTEGLHDDRRIQP
jgi:hypothetical protein